MVIESSRPFRLCATGNDIKGDEETSEVLTEMNEKDRNNR
jgi:hypothetical protein